MKKIGSVIVTLLSFLFSLSAWSMISVQASVDNPEISVGDRVTLTITVITDENEVDIQEPRLPSVQGLQLQNSWASQSVSQRMVSTPKGMEFQTQRRKDFNYAFIATASGRVELSAVEVIVNGKTYSTQPLAINIGGSGSTNRQARRPKVPQPEDDPFGFGFPNQDIMDQIDRMEEELFNQMLRNRGLGGPASPGEENEPAHRSMPKNMQEAFFVQVEVDKTDVYEGEQLTVNWYVYTRGQMETLDRLKFPALRGFWKEIIEEVPALVFQEEIINGVPWRKALLASHALFPIKAGQSYIDEFKIKSRVRLPVAGWGFGLGKAYEYTKSSERVKINVKPLPTAGRPSDFSGAVGRFEINAAVEGNTFPLNQPFTMKLRFEGEGNAKLIELPPIQWPDGLELYETKSDSKFFRDGRSFKEFTLLIIPRKQGDHVIPEIGLSMFDPNKGIYTRKTSKPINIHVGPALSSSETPSQRRSSVQEKRSAQIALPQPVASAEPTLAAHILSVPWAGGFFWIFGLLLVFAKAVFEFGWWRKKMTLRTQMRERLKRVENFAASSDVRRTGAEAVNALYLLLGRLGGKGGAEREFGKLLEALPPSILKAHGQKLSLAFEKFQTLGFAPEELVREWVQGDRLRTEVKDLINLVDKVLDSAAEENASEH